MGLGRAGVTVVLGMMLAGAAIAGGPIAAQAQVTCTQGTAALVRAVGPSSAPMLVPAQVHVTICSENGNVVAVIPAFQTVGPASAPMIIPTSTQVRTCAPTVVAATPTSGGGLTPALQFSQVGAGTVAIPVVGGGTVVLPTATSSSVSTMTVTSTPAVVTVVPTVVTSTPTAFTCF